MHGHGNMLRQLVPLCGMRHSRHPRCGVCGILGGADQSKGMHHDHENDEEQDHGSAVKARRSKTVHPTCVLRISSSHGFPPKSGPLLGMSPHRRWV